MIDDTRLRLYASCKRIANKPGLGADSRLGSQSLQEQVTLRLVANKTRQAPPLYVIQQELPRDITVL